MGETAEIINLSNRLPTPAEVKSAAEAAVVVARAMEEHNGTLHISDGERGTVQLSPALSDLIVDVLSHVARGEMVTLVATGALLTTQEAADMLNVSRPYISKLLREGKIQFIPVGTHRRIKLEELMKYRSDRELKRNEALEEIMEIGQELGV